MTHLTLDAALASKLHGLAGPTELRDDSGRVIGRFVPQENLLEWEPVTPDVDEAELDRRAKSDKWYSFDEVIAHLKSLEKH